MHNPKTQWQELRSRLAVLLLAAFAVLFTACGTTSTPLPATVTPPPVLVLFPTPPKGWKLYTTPTFQIALPEAWQEVVLAEEPLKNAIKQNQTTNADLARVLQDLLDSGVYKSLLFYAMDAKGSGVLSNVTVSHTNPSAETRSEDIAKKAVGALTKNVPQAKNVTATALVSVNGIDAALVKYDLTVKNANGAPVTLRGFQFIFLVSPQDLYVLTISGDAADDSFAQVADQVGKSFVAVKR